MYIIIATPVFQPEKRPSYLVNLKLSINAFQPVLINDKKKCLLFLDLREAYAMSAYLNKVHGKMNKVPTNKNEEILFKKGRVVFQVDIQ